MINMLAQVYGTSNGLNRNTVNLSGSQDEIYS